MTRARARRHPRARPTRTALPLEGSATPLQWSEFVRERTSQVERYCVVMNVVDEDGERLRVLSGYFLTRAGAEEERMRLSTLHPDCAVIATVSHMNPFDAGHSHEIFANVMVGLGYGDGLQ